MQHDKLKTTKIVLREDKAVGASSTAQGASLDGLGFNMDFILAHDPRLADQVLAVYRRACELDAVARGQALLEQADASQAVRE